MGTRAPGLLARGVALEMPVTLATKSEVQRDPARVPRAGVEPARGFPQRILSPLRLTNSAIPAHDALRQITSFSMAQARREAC